MDKSLSKNYSFNVNDYNDLYKCEFESGLMTFTAKKTYIK